MRTKEKKGHREHPESVHNRVATREQLDSIKKTTYDLDRKDDRPGPYSVRSREMSDYLEKFFPEGHLPTKGSIAQLINKLAAAPRPASSFLKPYKYSPQSSTEIIRGMKPRSKDELKTMRISGKFDRDRDYRRSRSGVARVR